MFYNIIIYIYAYTVMVLRTISKRTKTTNKINVINGDLNLIPFSPKLN